ncbi:hypothetical protein AB4Y64_13205 [Lysobacter sp. TAF61]|uniref:hypothetical protein n=1 Tax=Lysobacter sp. TAF61 TaxID=3233072 RepID=UPI003F9E15AD
MIKRAKPDFSRRPAFKVSDSAAAQSRKTRNAAPIFGFGVDPDFLPQNVRYELQQAARRSKLAPAQQEKLVTFATELAQRPHTSGDSIGDQRSQIDAIANDAQNLLARMRVLTSTTAGTLTMYANEACIVPPSPLTADIAEHIREIGSAEFLSQSWDMVEALESVARHASVQLKLLASKSNKPLETQQRGLVANLAAYHYQLTGEFPPKSNAAWFARFVRALGGHMGLHFEDSNAKPIDGMPFIGGRIPRTGIELVEKPKHDQDWYDAIERDSTNVRPWCGHDWPLPLSTPEPQNCRKCGGGRNGAPDLPNPDTDPRIFEMSVGAPREPAQ